MVWLDHDIDAKREILNCEGGCGTQVDETQIVLTRIKAQRQPPDILFTTAESLNQRLSDTYNREVFGIHRNRSQGARYLLLDEIHTYGGTSGAQAAMVLRRWRYARGAGEPVRYVGLSATLEDASRFFATLTGLAPQSVTEVAPHPERVGIQVQGVSTGAPGRYQFQDPAPIDHDPDLFPPLPAARPAGFAVLALLREIWCAGVCLYRRPGRNEPTLRLPSGRGGNGHFRQTRRQPGASGRVARIEPTRPSPTGRTWAGLDAVGGVAPALDSAVDHRPHVLPGPGGCH